MTNATQNTTTNEADAKQEAKNRRDMANFTARHTANLEAADRRWGCTCGDSHCERCN